MGDSCNVVNAVWLLAVVAGVIELYVLCLAMVCVGIVFVIVVGLVIGVVVIDIVEVVIVGDGVSGLAVAVHEVLLNVGPPPT